MSAGRWTRDGLTVDPAPWNPGLKYGARRRKSYEGQGCAELHLGRGTTPRPDTLAQTGQITRKSCLRTGGGHTFLKAATVSSSLAGWRGRALTCEKPSCLRILPIVRSW